MHFTPFKFFSAIQARVTRLLTSKFNLSDPRIRNLVDALNACPSTATVWSCSGHTHAEKPPKGEKPYGKTRAYIVFCIADQQASYVLETISAWMTSLGYDELHCNFPRLEMTQLHFCFKPDGTTFTRDEAKGPMEYYPCWSLEMTDESNEAGVSRLEQRFNDLAAVIRLATISQ